MNLLLRRNTDVHSSNCAFVNSVSQCPCYLFLSSGMRQETIVYRLPTGSRTGRLSIVRMCYR